MPSDSGESRARASKANNPAPEQEVLPCPRCDSTNTKFCYYNNYNFSQPRHFCKSCRRYWTHGGTLRDIPVGGGSRKNAKRSRTHHHHHATTTSSSQDLHYHHRPLPAATPGSFSSLLNAPRPGFLALTGFGLGGAGIEDMGFGIGRGVWPFPGLGEATGCLAAASGGVASGGNVMGNTWQLESGEGGFVGGECFSWPDLAISTPPVNGLK